MKVICLRDGFSDDKDTMLVKRGSIYNVTNVVKSKYNRQYKTNIWYELLETGRDLHLGAIFVLAPAEDEVTSISRKELQKIACN
jgi:hypothetical protein